MIFWAGQSPIKKTIKSMLCAATMCGAAVLGSAQAGQVTQPTATPLEERAAYYVEFRNDIDQIEAITVRSSAQTREIHNMLASHDPDQLSSGWVAYAALVAADNPEFAASIREAMKPPKKSKKDLRGAWRKKKQENAVVVTPAFILELRSNPQSVRNLPGAASAIEDILAVAARDAQKITQLSDRYTADAYATQNKGWAKKKITNGTSRVQSALDWSYSRPRMATPVLPAKVADGVQTPDLATVGPQWSPSWSGLSNSGSLSRNSNAVIDRILVLAARYSVGELNEPIVNGYAKNASGRKCVNMAKLNFDQCIAATRTANEEIFCIGKHGIGDMSSCVGNVVAK